MTKVKTFEKARKLTIDKWEKILKEMGKVENTIGNHCGFCLLAEYEVQQTAIGYKCTHCLVEAKCEEYKEVMMCTFNKFEEWINTLLRWLDNLEEKDTSSRYLENKNNVQYFDV